MAHLRTLCRVSRRWRKLLQCRTAWPNELAFQGRQVECGTRRLRSNATRFLQRVLGFKRPALKLSTLQLSEEDRQLICVSPLRKIRLEAIDFFEDPFLSLCSILTLTSLSLPAYHNIKAENLHNLRQLPLLHLDLSDSVLEGACMREIAGCSQLQELLLNKCKQLRPDELALLSDLPLRVLELDGTGVQDNHLVQLVGLPLTRLSLADCVITDTGLRYIALLPRLEELCIRATPIKGASFEFFTQRVMKELDLSATVIDSTSLLHLRKMEIKQLKLGFLPHLDLSQVCVKELILNNNDLLRAWMIAALKCPSLEALEVRGSSFDDESLSALIARPLSLKVLRLVDSEISLTGIQQLSKLALRELQLCHCRFEDRVAASVAAITTLETLALKSDDTKNTDKWLSGLACFKSASLRVVDLRGARCSENAIDAFLCSCPRITLLFERE